MTDDGVATKAKLTFGLVPSAGLIPPSAVADMRAASLELMAEAHDELLALMTGATVATVCDEGFLERLSLAYEVFGEALGSLRAISRIYTLQGYPREPFEARP
jgi:hypothetical protein